MTIKYFLYARKSTEDDDRQVMSIEGQSNWKNMPSGKKCARIKNAKQ